MNRNGYRFGVRARLALIITLLLAGVSGVQYMLSFSQQREVVEKLMELNRQINETVLQIDRQLKARSLPENDTAPAQGEQVAGREEISRELRDFMRFVESNMGGALDRQGVFREMLERINAMQRAAMQLDRAGGGSSFFQVTVSVMDEMSRRSPLWRYSISSQPAAPPSGEVLQVSIPVVEEGQVRFVHMQYEISDFLADFEHSRRMSLLITIVTLGLGLGVALFYTSRFTRPIRTLSEGFSRIERGDLDCRIATKRKDELGQLVDGFNHMVERLKQNKELEKSLYRQERLSSLGKLAAGIAHEIKNPLNAISLSLQHLGDKLHLTRPGDREMFDRYSGNIQREVGRLSKIVDTFLSFSRFGDLERAPVDLNALLDEVLTLLTRDLHDRGVRVETEFAGTELVANVDPEKMKTVFLNLIINAIEAMPSGGRLRLATEGGNGERARVTVSDTGCGIEPGKQEHIFDLYYSTKENGSGMGLALVNNILRDHGAEIRVESRLGTGTDFIITLPKG